MKKKRTAVWILIAVVIGVMLVWRVAYSLRKNTDNIPTLTAVAQMSEADINSLLTGYRVVQLEEVWGEPTCSKENEAIWQIGEVTLVVNYKNDGKVAVCGLKNPDGTSANEN